MARCADQTPDGARREALRRRAGLRRVAAAGCVIAALGMASACAPIYRNHGYIPLDADLAQLQIGIDTPETVTAKVGTPTSGGVLDARGYYFVSSRFRHLGFYAPEEIEREVVAISFSAAGVVENVERFGLSDGRVVVLSRRVTTDNVRDTTFIRQLLGSLGNFDAAGLIAGPE